MKKAMEMKAMIKQVVFAGLAWLGIAAGASAQTTIVEYIHTDALGSPVAVTDAAGALVPGQSQVYEPYGAPISHGPADGPGYTGHVEDSATGLTYMQQRYYDPSLGVFLSVDPVTAYSGAFPRYRFANGNPYRFVDPDGRETREKRQRNRSTEKQTGSHTKISTQAQSGGSPAPQRWCCIEWRERWERCQPDRLGIRRG